MSIRICYKHKDGFAPFLKDVQGMRVAVLYDVNTAPYAEPIKDMLRAAGCLMVNVPYADAALLPTEDKCARAQAAANAVDYVLAVGSGTLGDMAKFVSTHAGIPCGVLATAASMDGYCSAGAALMRGGFKVTDTVHPPRHVLIDLDVIKTAPRLMTAAGFGDIVGKYTCLADWELSCIINGETVHQEAYTMMEQARTACMQAYDGLTVHDGQAIERLMDALVTAGLSMALCGNSRPASGSEHHQSHYLEMDFARRGLPIPMHGIKVGIGTLVSLWLYEYIEKNRIACKNAEQVYALCRSLPRWQQVRDMLCGMGCPVRFSEIGVREQTMHNMIRDAHTVRDRYTVLTLIHELDLTNAVTPALMELFY